MYNLWYSNPTRPQPRRPNPDFLALWEGCFFSEPPSAEMVDVHRFAAFYDLPMEMIRFFFCQGESLRLSVAFYVYIRVCFCTCLHAYTCLSTYTRALSLNPPPHTTQPPTPQSPTEFYCDKAEELVARADYVRFMRWAALYLRAGPFEFKRKVRNGGANHTDHRWGGWVWAPKRGGPPIHIHIHTHTRFTLHTPIHQPRLQMRCR